ncbi:MAG: oligosaccharide flippase family protein [Sediminibacterium sp.]|nr:oligosaccharide flippase family protein [Sediminibacterium sp.]MBP6145238.1 oligosaccharide flippase family protein [Sediminibacterium sp.]
MSSIKKLASQTAWYGLSSIAARFISYLLTPYLTYKLSDIAYGENSIVYAFIPFLNVLVTHGMETAYFKFGSKENEEDIYNTSSISMLFVTGLVLFGLYTWRLPLADLLQITIHPEYISLLAWIVALDALTTIPFSRLRLQGRPKKFALIKVGGILLNILATYVLISSLPNYVQSHPGSFLQKLYTPNWEVGYILIAGIIQNVFVLILLQKEIRSIRFKFNFKLWRAMMAYALPLILVGFGGMINETLDRIMLGWWAPGGSPDANKALVGVYSACYKLAILITISIQAFRMGAEPFFFKQAESDHAQKTYARVMKFFVITLCVMFLGVVLYIDIWKLFIQNPAMYVGLRVVPILLIANMFLGVYYNLSIWYKLSNRTMAGAWITLLGALITVIINYIAIPHFGYMASAWATLVCYGTMMVVSYQWGQRVYPVPYATKKLIAYFVIALMVYGINLLLHLVSKNQPFNYLFATILLFAFIVFVMRIEKKELQSIFQK